MLEFVVQLCAVSQQQAGQAGLSHDLNSCFRLPVHSLCTLAHLCVVLQRAGHVLQKFSYWRFSGKDDKTQQCKIIEAGGQSGLLCALLNQLSRQVELLMWGGKVAPLQ